MEVLILLGVAIALTWAFTKPYIIMAVLVLLALFIAGILICMGPLGWVALVLIILFIKEEVL